MQQRASRRGFIGLGLGCAAPLLLSPLARTTGLFSKPSQSGAADPILEQLQGEMLGTYRRMRAQVKASGRVGGEELRAFGSHVRLLNAQMIGKGTDARVDGEVQALVRRDGRDAAALALSEEARAACARLALPGVRHPDGPDFAGAAAALDLLQRRGTQRVLHDLSRWAALEAARADRAAGRILPATVAFQKPGDDFGGYPVQDDLEFNCQTLTDIINSACLVIAVLTVLGQGAEAAVWGLVAAIAQYLSGLFC